MINKRVLIVDDHRDFIDRMLEQFKGMEESKDFECRFATDGDEAMKIVHAFLPDVILLDNMLAVEDSHFSFVNASEFYRALKKEGFHGISVVIMTYDPKIHQVEELRKLGVKDIFNKGNLFYTLDGFRNLAKRILSC